VALTVADLVAATQMTSTIPIVFAIDPDPVRSGLVSSLAHPGGNVTGLTGIPELGAKRLELLKEVVPSLSRVGLPQYAKDGGLLAYASDGLRRSAA
jgi:putative tryptophan/tyrosine transport system substrate-binding protein